MKLISLTLPDGKRCLMNPQGIMALMPLADASFPNHKTEIVFMGGQAVRCQEDINTIEARYAEAMTHNG